MKSLNYLVDHILYQGYFDYIIKKHETFTDNLSIRIHINKMENRMAFKIKKGYYLQLLTPKKMKLQRSTENNKVGTKGLWFVNHKISWSCETSIFHELFFPKYDNF